MLQPPASQPGGKVFQGLCLTKFSAFSLRFMKLFPKASLLFALNLLDALLTIVWVRNGVATEGNFLMAKLLEMGDLTFLAVKLAIGTFAAFIFLVGSETKLARYGLTVALALYISLMGIHVITGLSGLGMISEATIEQARELTKSFLAIFIA